MRVLVVHNSDNGECFGRKWCANQQAAKVAVRDFREARMTSERSEGEVPAPRSRVESVEVPTTKDALIAFLNRRASDPSNG